MRPKAPAHDPTVLGALHEAARHQQAGELAKAEVAYRRILERHPDQPDALHLLGIIMHRRGQSEAAEDLIHRAIAAHPSFPEALNNLGNILKEKGQIEKAAGYYRRAIEVNSRHAKAHYNLANVLRDMEQADEAIASYRRALDIDPNYAAAHNNLGSALQDQGETEDAMACYQRALRINPGHADAQNNLGSVLLECERPDEAETRFREAIGLNPRHVDALWNLGNVLRDGGRFEEAVALFRHALSIDPSRAKIHSKLGLTLANLRRLDEAFACCSQAIEIDPSSPKFHCDLGIVIHEQGDLEAAEAAFRTALELDPEYVRALLWLGGLFKNQGRLPEAEAELRRALRLKPDFTTAHSNLLFSMNCRKQEPRASYEAHRAWNAQHARPLRGEIQPWTNNADPERRLRVGYVSADFRFHSVSYFFEPLLEAHDHNVVEVFCYADVARPDAVTDRIRNQADHWRSSVGVSDAELARRIRADGIDILVDLTGHTGGHRLLVFARKPAPVQVTWLGYPNTTGLDAMDYRLVDAITDPKGTADESHSEKLIRLPESFLCFRPWHDASEVAPLPCLEEGHVTFGSFNNLSKVTPEAIEAWAKILRAVPMSRLLLKGKAFADEPTRYRYLEMFPELGIETERLELTNWQPTLSSHLDLYSRVDIGLDTFPYNGTTTTCEALWMGVPVVTLAGTQHAGRVGASLLHSVGLDELVTESLDHYVDVAVMLTRHPDKLADLRAGLRQRLRNSVLCQPKRFANSVEAAYRTMWRKWCGSDSAGPGHPERVEKN